MNSDITLLNLVKKYSRELIPEYENNIKESLKKTDEMSAESNVMIEHPLDDEVQKALDVFELRDDDDEYRIFNYTDKIKTIWKLIIEKSIKCLRFFDEREPFLKNFSKHPIAYGTKELGDYFEKYTKFEAMLYGGGKYYRDHVVHVFRVWLLGMECLLSHRGAYLEKISINKDVTINNLEKISIWSMIALTHDLGYPLEKAQNIIDQTKDMMKLFISNPTVSMNLSFNGIQNNMNDFVVRFMSSKMHEDDRCRKNSTEEKKRYVARLQPKYYFKFQKSLEGYNHGILSAIIIYKLLIYFLESDFSINEDYKFDEEEARQFYIRREILRTVAAHTCQDVYHLDMLNFAFLLIVVDDAQEWGRKRITELYRKDKRIYEFDSITPYFAAPEDTNATNQNVHRFVTKEKFTFPKDEQDSMKNVLSNLMKQSKRYEQIFRDGQDTEHRNFDFEKICEIAYEDDKKVNFLVNFKISNKNKPQFSIEVSSADNDSLTVFGAEFLKDVYKNYAVKCENQNKNGGNKVVYEII